MMKANSKQKSSENVKTGVKKKSSKAPLLIVVTLIFVYIAYVSISRKFFPDSKVQIAPQVTSTDYKIVAPSLTLEEEQQRKEMSENKCSELGDFCSVLKINHPFERVVLSEDRVTIYVNLPLVLKEVVSDSFFKEEDSKQAEYILARLALHPVVRKLSFERNLKYVVVTGIEELSDLSKIKYSVIMDVLNTPVFTDEEHRSFFSNLIIGGVYRPYRVHVKPYVQLIVH